MKTIGTLIGWGCLVGFFFFIIREAVAEVRDDLGPLATDRRRSCQHAARMNALGRCAARARRIHES